MNNLKNYFILFLIFVAGACTRQQEGFSTIKIQAPSKNGTFAAIPSGRVACYGVNVTGTGITGTPESTCKPASGTFLGFAESGAAIQGQVAKGKARKIDVYLYLQGVSENIPCASIAPFVTARPDKLYLIGSVPSIDLEKETETVNISTTFPGEGSSLYVTNSYPGSCLPTPVNVASNYQISPAYGVSTGGGYVVHARVGRTTDGVVLTGSGIILKVKE